MLDLDDQVAFASGGNRLCFIDPRDRNRCVKVAREDRLPAIKKAEQNFPRNCKPEKYFNDNWQEWRVYQKIDKTVGICAYELIPKCYGLIDTSLGQGLVTDIILDQDLRISMSLKQYIWLNGKTAEIMDLIDQFIKRWSQLGMPSRNLLLHNIVVQMVAEKPKRLFVIDGLGWSDLLQLGYWFKSAAKAKAGRKASRIYTDIDKLLDNQLKQNSWGYHGWMDEQQRLLPVARKRL